MTNLLTVGVITLLATNTITLKTNVTETFNDPSPNVILTNGVWLNQIYGGYYNHPPAPTAKWRITEVYEERRLSFTWNGKPDGISVLSNVSRTITKMKRKEEWEAVK